MTTSPAAARSARIRQPRCVGNLTRFPYRPQVPRSFSCEAGWGGPRCRKRPQEPRLDFRRAFRHARLIEPPVRSSGQAGAAAIRASEAKVLVTVLLQQQQPPSSGVAFLITILPIILIFYLLLFLPMQRQRKRQQKMLASLETGQTVLTNGGIIGTIVAINRDDDTLVLRVKPDNVKLQVTRSAVAAVVPLESKK